MNGALGFAFAAGAVATVNPCGFALLPAYLSRQLADGQRPGSAAAAGRAFGVGALATLGFLLVFASAGSAMALGARALTRVFPWVGFVVGLLLAGFGLAVLVGRQPGLHLPQLGRRGRASRLRGEFLFGIGYGLASLSCALPLFLATLGTALTGSLLTSVLSFVAYALGMGTVLTLVALAAALSRHGLARALRRLLPYVERASGALLFAAGVYVTDYWAVDLWRPGSGSAATAPVTAGGRLATSASTWLASTATKTALLIAAVCLTAAALWKLRQRASRTHPGHVDPARPDRRLTAAAVSRRLLAVVAVAALVLAAGAYALIGAGRDSRPLDRSALLGFVDPTVPAPPFALRDQFGNLVRLDRLRGRPILIAFVYSHCRDACPLTAAKIRAAQQELGSAAGKLAWLAISVEPRTDTTASVRAFSRHAGLLHSWHYLFQPRQAVSAALHAYGIQPQLTTASASQQPYLQHGAYLALLDRNGRRIESFTDASLTTADLVHDLRLIIGEHPTTLQPATTATATATATSAPAPADAFAPVTPRVAVEQGVLSLTGTDLVSGQKISLGTYAGMPVVLNAWASWCAGCAAEAPALADFARAHPEAAVVGIDLEDSRNAGVAFSRRFALPFLSVFDPGGVSAARLQVSGLPTTIFLDRRHQISGRIVGEADRARFEAGLRHAERP